MRRKYVFRTLLLLILSPSAVAEMHCPETEYGKDYQKKAETIDKPLFIHGNTPVVEDSRMYCQVRYYYTERKNHRSRREDGEFQGYKYRIFHTDGSGTLQGLPDNNLSVKDKYKTNWSFRCKRDEFDDTHWCQVSREGLSVTIWKDGSVLVNVGAKHYPGTNVSVRIDDSPPYSATEKVGFNTGTSNQILDELLSGDSVMTRYQKWPYKRYIDQRVPLFGFTEAWALLNRIYKAPK